MSASIFSQMNCLLVQAIFAAALGMFQFGFTSAINSPQIYIKQFIADSYRDRGSEISDRTVSFLFSLAVAAVFVSGILGALSAGYLADRFGRRNSLLYVQALSVVGGVLTGVCRAAGSFELLFAGRFLVGVACGVFTSLVPVYITEIAPVSIRGGLGVSNNLAAALGIFSGQLLGLDIFLGTETGWPWLLSLGCVVPAVLQIVMLPFMPESPMYLILNKADDDAGLDALGKLRKSKNIAETEFEDMKMTRDKMLSSTDPDDEHVNVVQVLKSSDYRLPLLIAIMVHLSQQLSGIIAIFSYSTGFFIAAGIPQERAQYGTLGVGAIMVIMSFVTIPLMDKLGRRTLHLTGLMGVIGSSILITIAQNLDPTSSTSIGVFLIVSTLSFVVFFALGPGVIAWLIAGELFKQGPRPAASAIVTGVNWSANLLVTLVFPLIAESSISNFTFIPFATIVLVLLVFLWVYLPETKGKPVEDIAIMLKCDGALKGAYNRK